MRYNLDIFTFAVFVLVSYAVFMNVYNLS
jgi:hypothetical protein